MSFFGEAQQGRTQAEDDAFWAWMYASNCLLYENDPGPAQLNIATVTEPAWVSRSDAWRDAYAHLLLEQVQADHVRLLAAAAACRAELAEIRTAHNTLTVFGRRLRGTEPWPRRLRLAVGAFSPRGRRNFQRVHRRAIDLCELAARLVAEAGAATDAAARRRLLAGTRHTNRMIALGVVPGAAEDSLDQLNRELDAINDDN